MSPDRKWYKKFGLGFLFASILYWPVVWIIYDGPMINMLPGMFGAAIAIGLVVAWPDKAARSSA